MGNWRDRADKFVKNKKSKGRFKLSEGDNVIRILPTLSTKKDKEPSVFTIYYAHGEVGPKKRFIRCGKNEQGKGDCWICDKTIPKLEESESKAKRRLAEAMAPKEQFVVQIAKYDTEEEKFYGPFLWAVSSGGARSLAARLMNVIRKPKRIVEDLKKGYNLSIDRTGTTFKTTEYGDILVDDEPTKVPDEIADKMKPFDKLIPAYEESVQKAAYFGRDEDDMEDDDEDEEDDKVSKKKKGRKIEEEEDEEEETKDDEEETEDDDDDDDEESSSKKKKKKKKKDEDDEEEDDEEEEEEEEEDDDDEDESSKKKKSKKSKDDDDDEEEEEEEDEEEEDDDDKDDDDEEEEKSSKKKSKKKKKDEEEEEEDEEEEDDDDEEDEEEEDESPKKKKKKKSRR